MLARAGRDGWLMVYCLIVPIAIGKWQNPLHIIKKIIFNINRKLSSFSFGEGQEDEAKPRIRSKMLARAGRDGWLMVYWLIVPIAIGKWQNPLHIIKKIISI
jgi:hypothetical protein